MYKDKKVLGLIPARGGSKGIKNKNIVLLHGKPLIEYTITAALNSQYIDDVVVTTDSELIASVAKNCGAQVPFLRPAELATDTSKSIDALVHAVRKLESLGKYYDIVVWMQPTTPLRNAQDIDASIEWYYSHGEMPLASVCPVDEHPILMRTLKENGELVNLLNCSSTVRRQDMPQYYRVDGCITINNTQEVNSETSLNDNPLGFVMDPSHSVDIDDLVDLVVADYYIAQQND